MIETKKVGKLRVTLDVELSFEGETVETIEFMQRMGFLDVMLKEQFKGMNTESIKLLEVKSH